MNIKNNIKSLITFLLAGIITVGVISCNDKWDEHYKDPEKNITNKSLWQNIQETPELSIFAEILEKTGYDKVLSKSQMFTVWAPDNDALKNLNIVDTALVNEFLDNHIAMFSMPASGAIDKPISMLNGKVVRFHLSEGNQYYFGNVLNKQSNILSTNGVLHIINGYVPFQDNIWEYLLKEDRISDISKYLYSFNDIVFDPGSSIPGGGYDDEGNTIYLDSVYINLNEMFSYIGRINNEDSLYTMIVPDNRAWNAKYNEAKEYYKFYDKSILFADSLQDVFANLAVVSNLVFSDKMQLSPEDSLVSTRHTVFKNPANLLLGAEEIEMSNGRIFITDSLRFSPSESWHSFYGREAETILGRLNEGSTILTRSSMNTYFENISFNSYIEVAPIGPTTNPTVTFEIPFTLSATYNIYCVFVPEIISKPESQARPFKVAFQILYLDEKGNQVQTSVIRPAINTTDKYSMTKMLVYENFKFPVTGVLRNTTTGIFEYTTKVKVISDARGSAEQNAYSRNLLIDRIILEPVD